MKLYDDKKEEVMIQLCMAFGNKVYIKKPYKVVSLLPLSCHRIISYFDTRYFFCV